MLFRSAPTLRILAPADGARIDALAITLLAEAPADAALVAARTGGGPWQRGIAADGPWRIDLPLDFGPQTIEVMAADADGTVAVQSLHIEGVRQPDAGGAPERSATEPGLISPAQRPDLEIDLFKSRNGLFVESTPEASAAAARLRAQAAAAERLAQAQRLAKEQARSEEALRQAAIREVSAREAEAEATARAEAARRLREAEAEAEAERLRIEARDAERARQAELEREAALQLEAERQREAELQRQATLQRQAQQEQAEAARREREAAERLRQEAAAREAAAIDPRDAELQRLRQENARLQMEQALIQARNEAERLRLELELERSRNAAAPAAPVPAPWAATPPPAAPAVQPPAPPPPAGRLLFEIEGDGKLRNGPNKASKFELDSPQVISLIRTTHWNGGRGAQPGSIAIRCRDGKLYGPWAATGQADASGTGNVYWLVRPNVRLPATVCSVIDSDPTTWSYTDDSMRRGLVRIEGYAATSDENR